MLRKKRNKKRLNVFAGSRRRRRNMRAASMPAGIEHLEDRKLLAAVYGDFNADGADDFVRGDQYASLENISEAGQVLVAYGVKPGETQLLNQTWHQFRDGLSDTSDGAEEGDQFGAALAVGDFNADGFDDLAVGIPKEDIGSIEDAGAVQILYGSASGLTSAGNQFFHQDSPDVNGSAESGDLFGSALAAGNFNGDFHDSTGFGFDDLAIGVPGENLEQIFDEEDAGAVNVIYGSESSLNPTGPHRDDIWTQDTYDVDNHAEDDDSFGDALSAADFNHDGYADLAISSPDEGLGIFPFNRPGVGIVQILHGSSTGLHSGNDQEWRNDDVGGDVGGDNQLGDQFGIRTTTGDFNGDGVSDLVVGTTQSFEDAVDGGSAYVIHGGDNGLTSSDSQFWRLGRDGIPGTPDDFVTFAKALAAGDFNGDGFDDLAIGIPEIDELGFENAGEVIVLYGTADGLDTSNLQLLHQGLDMIPGELGNGQFFGRKLAAGDRNGDGLADLSIRAFGLPNSNRWVHLYGTGNGLSILPPATTPEVPTPPTFPAAPLILQPGEFTDDIEPLFRWSRIGMATSYEFLLYNNGVLVYPNLSIGSTSFTAISELKRSAPGTVYTAYVRAVRENADGSIELGGYSPAHEFFILGDQAGQTEVIVINPPGDLIAVSPALIEWDGLPDAEDYEVLIYDLSAGQEALHELIIGSTFIDVGNLSADATYQMFVRGVSENGDPATPFSAPLEFTLLAAAAPPAAPVFYDRPATYEAQPLIRWGEVNGADHYEVLMYDLDAGQQVAHDAAIENGGFRPDFALTPARYQAFVRGVDLSGTPGDYSSPLEFDVIGQPGLLAAPSVTGPEGAVNDLQPTITWTPIAGAGGYELLIYEKDAGQLVVHELVELPATQSPIPLSSSQVHQVFVRAIDVLGQPAGAFSDPFEFTPVVASAVTADEVFALDDPLPLNL